MPLSAVAARYANALADVVTRSASALDPKAAVAELRAFESALGNSAELHTALVTPAIAGSRKKAVVARVADALQLSRISRNFLFILVDHRRIASLSSIIQSFELVIDERLGFARADISSARELTEPQRGALNARLEQLTGKRIRPHFAVDSSLIGGVVARIGSTIYDGSVRGQLQSLERRLSAEG
jgi:F-type H+-transporting ATPase subunit delta